MIFKKVWLMVILSSILAYSNALDPEKITVDELIRRMQNPTQRFGLTRVILANVEVNTDTEEVYDISEASLDLDKPLILDFVGSKLSNLRFINFTKFGSGGFTNGTLKNITFSNITCQDYPSCTFGTKAWLNFDNVDIDDMTVDGGSNILLLVKYQSFFRNLVVSNNSKLQVERPETYGTSPLYFDITVDGDISGSNFRYAGLNFTGDAGSDRLFNMDNTNFLETTGAFNIYGNRNEINNVNLRQSRLTVELQDIIANNWDLDGAIWKDANISNFTGRNIRTNNTKIEARSISQTQLYFEGNTDLHLFVEALYGGLLQCKGKHNRIDLSGSGMHGGKIVTGSNEEPGEGSGFLNMDGVVVTRGSANDRVEVTPIGLNDAELRRMRIERDAALYVGEETRRPEVDRVDLTGTEIQEGGLITLMNMNIRTLDLTGLRGEGTLFLDNVHIQNVIGANLQQGINTVGTLTIRVVGGNIGTLRLGAAPTSPNARIMVEAYPGPEGQLRAGDVNFGAGTSGPPPPYTGLRSSADAIQTNIDCNTANYVLYPNGTWCYKRND